MGKLCENGMMICFELFYYASNNFLYASVLIICFLYFLLFLSYNYSCCQHAYYASLMNKFESEYPFGNFLEDTSFDELR